MLNLHCLLLSLDASVRQEHTSDFLKLKVPGKYFYFACKRAPGKYTENDFYGNSVFSGHY